jgi:hypothetical protein
MEKRTLKDSGLVSFPCAEISAWSLRYGVLTPCRNIFAVILEHTSRYLLGGKTICAVPSEKKSRFLPFFRPRRRFHIGSETAVKVQRQVRKLHLYTNISALQKDRMGKVPNGSHWYPNVLNVSIFNPFISKAAARCYGAGRTLDLYFTAGGQATQLRII